MTSKAEIEKTIEQFFEALDTQNAALMMGLLPKDETMVHIGTDAGEVWKGWAVMKRETEEQFEDLEYYKAKIRDLTIHLSESGHTAWYFHRLDAEIKSSRGITKWNNARFTGVLEKRDQRWVFVQTHVSVPDSTTH